MSVIKDALGYSITRLTTANKKFYIYCIVLLIISVLGLGGAVTAVAEGHHHSNMSDMVPWGILISGLAFFIGLSAGATMVGLLIHGFGRDDYHPIGTRAILVGMMCIFAAMGCVMMDVGNPFRAMKIPFLLRNETSMFFISSSSYMGFTALLMAELVATIYVTIGKASSRGKKIAKILGICRSPLRPHCCSFIYRYNLRRSKGKGNVEYTSVTCTFCDICTCKRFCPCHPRNHYNFMGQQERSG